MSDPLHGSYQAMVHPINRVYGRHFFVYVASETKNAHREWISDIKRLGHSEVKNKEDTDYFLVFCPLKSRIKTDIDEALAKVPGGKPVILMVMHHTFNPNTIIIESRAQVTRPDVRLTTDSLFYEGKRVPCNYNRIAWNQIQTCLGVPAPQPLLRRIMDCVQKHKKLIIILSFIAVGIYVVADVSKKTKGSCSLLKTAEVQMNPSATINISATGQQFAHLPSTCS